MKSTFLTLITSVAIVAICQAEAYNLKINRPEKVGYKADFTATAVDQTSQKFAVGGELVKDEDNYQSGSLDAVREVLAVNDKGKPTKLKFTVKSIKFSADKAAAPKEIVGAGKEVIAVRKGKEMAFTIDGAAADDDTAKALALVISLEDENNALDAEAMFNTKAPHAVGDEWDAGVDELIKSLKADMPMQFDPKASSGKIKLERVEKVSGIDSCILSASFTLIPSGMGDLPAGSDLTGSTLKIALTCPAPVDPATPELGGKMIMDMAIKADIKTPDGGMGKLVVTSKMAREESIKPIK